jgi:DinB superfamily
MTDPSQPEVWLRGPLPDYPDELQPVAHSLLQVREEIAAVAALPPEHLWARPGGAASIGFHLRHLAGSLDRLLTYARGDSLNAVQHAALSEEGRDGRPEERAETLVQTAQDAIDRVLAHVRTAPLCTLDEVRPVGRAGLPSTVLGLLFHAAEHAQRHSAQIITTAKIVKGIPCG